MPLPKKSMPAASAAWHFVKRLLVLEKVRHQLFIQLCLLQCLALFFLPFTKAWIVSVFLGFFWWLLLRHSLERPFHHLISLTRFGGFDVLEATPIPGGDEFSRLARGIQSMALTMRNSVSEAQAQGSRFDEILGVIGEGVCVLDTEGHILQMNHTLRRWLSWYGDVSGQHASEILHNAALLKGISHMVEQIRLKGNKTGADIEPVFIENVFIEAAESRRVRAKIVRPENSDSNSPFLIFLFDTSEFHKAEELRRDFFANVSHELKTPIAAIKGYAEISQDLIGKDPETNEQVKNFLGVISRNAEQLTSLIEQMLVLSQVESGQVSLNRKSYDIKSALDRVRETLLPRSREAQVSIEVDIPAPFDPLCVDSERFDSVLQNLMDNGIKYNRPGGKVKVSARRQNGWVQIFVEDTGIGMPDSAKNRIFERFYRVDKAHTRLGGGSGLGLAIVKHIVQTHGGQITVDSEVNVGTVFTLTLPEQPLPSAGHSRQSGKMQTTLPV